MNEESFPRITTNAIVERSQFRGKAGTRWVDEMQHLAKERLGIDTEHFTEVAEDWEAWFANLGFVSPRRRELEDQLTNSSLRRTKTREDIQHIWALK